MQYHWLSRCANQKLRCAIELCLSISCLSRVLVVQLSIATIRTPIAHSAHSIARFEPNDKCNKIDVYSSLQNIMFNTRVFHFDI